MHALAERLQPLADALAVSFAQGGTSAACAATLNRLLPGLQYASLAIANPARGGVPFAGPALVAAANLAAQGPCTLHLLDAHFSAAGLALQQGKPLKARISQGAGLGPLAPLADLQLLLAAAPAAQLVLCIPFGGETDSAATGQQPRGQQGTAGVLVFGLSGAGLAARRLALVSCLAQCLPRPLARLSADTLALVNFACGSYGDVGPASCCCCEADSDEADEGWEGGQCRPCEEGGSEGSTGPQALAVRRPEPGASESQDCELPSNASGPIKRQAAVPPRSGTPSPETPQSACPSSASSASSGSSGSTSGLHGVSRALAAAAAAAGGEALLQQSRLTLRFASEQAEREYGLWMAPHHLLTDRIASLLLVASMLIIAFIKPFQICDPTTLCLAAGMALPLASTCISRLLGLDTYTAWRQRFVICFRLYAVAYACFAGIPAYRAALPDAHVSTWSAVWRLTGAEALFLSALGFPLPLKLHLAVQGTALAIAVSSLPRMCAQANLPGLPTDCLLQSAACAAILGCLLPTLLLRRIERRSRATFAGLVQAEATSD